MFHHVVERKQSSDVSLRLLDPTVEFLQFLAWRCVAPLHFDLMRPQPMHQLVRHDVGKERIGYPLDSGSPYRLWFAFSFPGGRVDDPMISDGIDGHCLLREAK